LSYGSRHRILLVEIVATDIYFSLKISMSISKEKTKGTLVTFQTKKNATSS